MPFVCPVVPSPETSLLRSARRAGVMQVLVFAVTFLVAVAPHRSSAQAQAHTSNPINSASWGALPTSAQVRVSSAIGNDRRQYYFVSQPGSFSARLGHGVAAEFTKRRATFNVEGSTWGLALRKYGYGALQRRVPSSDLRAQRNRIE